ncbi:hypothetical protein CDL15_Pgr015586 [Punica granatum]|uniref:Uncharacterized protein n=1 Tax=Punica granatum TaxID=22663 RepID=A0A218XPW9_PUNGR|nr:hypothetical protein CDL15_Pgr015586 [Punica granatum]
MSLVVSVSIRVEKIPALASSGSVCENQILVATCMDITRLKMPEDSAGLLAGSVADSEEEVSTSICCNLENEIGIEVELAPARGPFVGRKTEWVLCEEEDSLSLEGDQFLDSSVASETSSLCGEDFLGIEAANSLEVERRLYSSIEILAGAASELGCESTTMQVVVNGPVSIATGLEDGLSPSLNSNSSAVVLPSPLSTQLSTVVGRSVFEVECVPLWGFTSKCGRRPEMEDALATLPKFT